MTPARRRLLVAVALALGCAPTAFRPSLTVEDGGAVRARVSACLGLTLSSAAAFTGPEAIGGLPDDVLACIAASTDCAAVLACAELSGPPCQRERCDGDVAVHCRRLPNGRTAEVTEDCAGQSDGNSRCALVDDDGKGIFAVCHAGTCAGDRCEGDRLISCLGAVEITRDCAREQRTCVAQADQAFCALRERCARDHCQGATAIHCRAGHADVRRDCPADVPGGRCRDQDGAVDCAAATWATGCPVDEPYSSHCDGSSGVVCRAGSRLSVDCPAFLNSTCTTDPTRPEARCRLPGTP